MVPRKSILLVAVLCMETTAAFVPAAPSQSLTRSITRPRTAAVASPFEDLEKERQKKDNNDDNDDWTEVEGGFIPRIGRLRRPASTIVEVDNLIDYKKEVVDCEEEIVVVKFYSTWCRSCKAMAPLYKKLSQELTTTIASIKFVQVPVSAENAVLHKGLGVPSVPFGHIYHKGAGLVEEQSLNKKEFRAFKDTLQSYVDGNCEVSP